MGIFSSIPLIGKVLDRTADIVEKAVVDKDQRNQIIGSLNEVANMVYLAELQTKTIPWVDATHKMGRQILNFASISAAVTLILLGYEITSQVALLLGGPNVAYQLIKGKGK
jgi:hypothetical protein